MGAVVNAVSVLSFADFVCRCVVSSIVAKLLDEIDETGNRIDPHLRGPALARATPGHGAARLWWARRRGRGGGEVQNREKTDAGKEHGHGEAERSWGTRPQSGDCLVC